MKFKRLNKIKFMKKMASFPIDEAEFENFDYTQITENDLLNDDSWYKYFVYAKRNNRKDIFEHVKSLAKSIDARLVPEIRKYFEKICKKYDEEDINDYLNSEMGYISYGSGGYLSFMWGDDFLDHDYRDAVMSDTYMTISWLEYDDDYDILEYAYTAYELNRGFNEIKQQFPL